jgi:probable rRNA maturation factor
MAVHLIDRQKKPAIVSASTIRRRAEKILEGLGKSDAELSLVLTDDEEIQSLNAQWRDKDKPTDVLSFPQDEEVLGDVVISIETASTQAGDPDGWARAHANVEGDWTILDETTLLLIHGVLHLLGHDHHKKTEAKRMQQEEARLFSLVTRREAAPIKAPSKKK